MDIKKKLILPLVLVAALGAGTAALTGCVELKTGAAAETSTPSDIPQDIPYVDSTGNSSSVTDKQAKTYTYNLDTAQKDAVKAAGDLLVSKGFTKDADKTYSNAKYTVKLSGGDSKLTYNITEK